MVRRLRNLLLLTALLAATVALPVPAAGAAMPGAVTDITWWGTSKAEVDREVELLDTAGVKWVRANINWSELEPNGKGQIDDAALARFDYAIQAARNSGLRVVMPISDGVPYWASSDPNKRVSSNGDRVWDKRYPPADMTDYGDIAGWVAEHYEPMGVRVFEIWNEPNLSHFWKPAPNPAAYVRMLKAGHNAIEAANPDAKVLLGGLSKSDFEFLEDVYDNGGRRYFDGVAVHPYTGTVDPLMRWLGRDDPGSNGDPTRLSWNCFPAIEEIRRTMVEHGNGRKRVWLTEFGWSTGGGLYGVSELTQALYLKRAFNYLESMPWVKAAFWYSARNNTLTSDSYEREFGLFSGDFKLKPSYHALRDYAR